MTENPVLATKYPGVLAQLVPYVVATPDMIPLLNLPPFGVPVGLSVNPLRMDSRPFLERIQVIDRLSFGPRGLHMPQWIFFDGAAITGAVFGFAIPQNQLTSSEREVLQVKKGDPDWIPLSIYAAIPSHQPGVWVGHNLSSLKSLVPHRPWQGLGLLTKALALKMFQADFQCGVTQWSTGALHIHTRFGPLELLSAYTPAHTRPDSLTYRLKVEEPHLRAAVGDPEYSIVRLPPDMWLEGRDTQAMLRLQDRLEKGEKAVICGQPEGKKEESRVPVAFLK
ncbi:MAG: hypothetical protein OEW12_02260 [Deltaproteobacteria bacterium]|nr:hypothetical protein [Deltaproteobacteria bacterium]